MKKLLLLIILFVSSFAGIAQNISYVQPTASGTGLGTSWANASADMQLMINNSVANDQVWVAGGTYKPFRRADSLVAITPNNRDNAFVLAANVKVYGGFAGTETTLGQRDLTITTNKSILSGDFNGDDSANFTRNGENAYHVLIAAGALGTAELNGFTVSGGNANNPSGNLKVNGSYTYRSQGAGIANSNSSAMFTHVTISGNKASNGGGVAIRGGSPLFNQAIISGNSAVTGGGIYTFSTATSPIFTNVIITGNNASTYGSGVYVGNSSINLTNVTISGNVSGAEGGSGVYTSVASGPSIIINNSIIYGNYGNSSQVYNSGVNSPKYQNSLVSNSTSPGTNMVAYNGPANGIFKNPLNPALSTGGDYTLAGNSPAIDVGSDSVYNLYGNAGNDMDLAGKPRLYNSIIDLGAYEVQARTVVAVTLVSFTALPQGNNDVKLQWQTASELNNKGYGIEISSTNNVYQNVSFMQAKGTISGADTYQTIVPNLAPGTYYFRLKITDLEGNFTYSPIRVVKINEVMESVINIYPNPVTDGYMYVNILNGNNTKATIKITNPLGQLIKQTDYITIAAPLKIILPATKGAYFIEVTTGDGKIVAKKVMRL